MDKEKVLGLAKLARISLSEDEAEKLSREFEAILGYVSEVRSIKPTDEEGEPSLYVKNVLRGDSVPHESGIYTEKILNLAPERKDNYFKVKKIL